MDNGGQTVRNEHDRPVFADFFDGLLYFGLRHIVKRRSCLIEQDDAVILQDTPRNGKPLPLTATVTNSGSTFNDEIYIFVDGQKAGARTLSLEGGATADFETLAPAVTLAD